MNSTQKIIKYCAIAFAFFLIFNILFGIMTGISFVSNIFDDDNEISDNYSDLEIIGNANILDIDIRASKLEIKIGDYLKAETNNKYITVKQDNNKLIIKEKKHSIFSDYEGKLVVYVPDNLSFDRVSIDAGAGSVKIDKLTTNTLDLELGAGSVRIDTLNVFNNANIDGGAGELIISDGSMKNVDMELGVGRVIVDSKLMGKSKFDCGVGEFQLNVIGDEDDYKVIVDRGLGSIQLDGEDIKSNTYYGNGDNIIDIDGGVGSIKINYINDASSR